MSQITDTSDAPLTYLYYYLPESSDGAVMVVRSPGGTGRFLKADASADLRVLGRRAGTSDAFVDLATSPLELTWADPADIEIKPHANGVVGLQHRSVTVTSTRNP